MYVVRNITLQNKYIQIRLMDRLNNSGNEREINKNYVVLFQVNKRNR